MTDNEDFPGFIDDKPKQPLPKPAHKPPAAPADEEALFQEEPAKPVRPGAKPAGFNPFADIPVKAAPTFASSSPAPASRAADTEADVKPGQGRDLWSCPHCGARNKPDRASCRSCGKRSDEEVIVPWHQQPAARYGMIGGAAVVLLLLIMSLFGGGVKLKPASVDFVDDKLRFGGSGGSTIEIGETKFVPRKQIALCGRVVGSQTFGLGAGFTTVVLVYGDTAKSDEEFGQLTIDWKGELPKLSGSAKHVVMHMYYGDNVPNIANGEYFSFKGEYGTLEKDGFIVAGHKDNPDYVVHVTEFEPK
jgi:hypothetical protein